MDMRSDVLKFYSEQNVDGIVIEALGQGNLPPCVRWSNGLFRKGIPVILVSRSFNGIVGPIYGYNGGGYDLEQRGLFFKWLEWAKARLKLLVAISNHLNEQQLKSYFDAQV